MEERKIYQVVDVNGFVVGRMYDRGDSFKLPVNGIVTPELGKPTKPKQPRSFAIQKHFNFYVAVGDPNLVHEFFKRGSCTNYDGTLHRD